MVLEIRISDGPDEVHCALGGRRTDELRIAGRLGQSSLLDFSRGRSKSNDGKYLTEGRKSGREGGRNKGRRLIDGWRCRGTQHRVLHTVASLLNVSPVPLAAARSLRPCLTTQRGAPARRCWYCIPSARPTSMVQEM